MKTGETKTFPCLPDTIGRVLNITKHHSQYLTLCEVIVYGEGMNISFNLAVKCYDENNYRHQMARKTRVFYI